MSVVALATRLSNTLEALNIEANYRVVAMASAVAFAIIKLGLGKRGGVDWYPMIHALIATTGSLLCLCIDGHAASIDPGMMQHIYARESLIIKRIV
jgi:hypothetical protein